MALCNCDVTFSNTGVNGCKSIIGATKKDVFVLKYDSTGAKNKIASTDFVNGILPDTYVQSMLNNPDKSKRWYPTPNVYEEPTQSQNDSIIQSFASGTSYKVADGAIIFSGILPKQEFSFIGQLKPAECVELAKYTIDDEGNLIGKDLGDGHLYPSEVNSATFDVKPIFGTDTTIPQVSIAYEYKKSEKAYDLAMISASNIETDMLTINGLVDLTGVASGVQSTSLIRFRLSSKSSKYGGTPYKGALLTSFVFKEGVTVINPTSLTELENGIYEVDGTFTAAGNVTISQASGQMKGYELTAFNIAIP